MLAKIDHAYGISLLAKILLHYITPIGAVIDWLKWEQRKTYKWNYVLIWLIYPLIYFIYTIIRGFFTDLYPYPFINVLYIGYKQVSINSLFLTLVFILIGNIYIYINKYPILKKN